MQLVNTFAYALMAHFMVAVNDAKDEENGQTLVEYGLILALISIAAIAIMGTVGTNIVSVFNAVANKLHS